MMMPMDVDFCQRLRAQCPRMTEHDRIVSELENLRAVNADLRTALEGLLADIDSGFLVRSKDTDADWPQKVVPYVQRLHAANDALIRARAV
jgi:hypothetical protein